MRDREIYYDARRDDGLATAKWREPTRSDRLPVHRSESPTGYSSAGCSPAEPASASPVTDIVVQSRSSAAIKCAAQLPCRDAVQVAPPRARRERECHLYFARRVTFLSCADIGVSPSGPGARRTALRAAQRLGHPVTLLARCRNQDSCNGRTFQNGYLKRPSAGRAANAARP